jgi:hypothetical protein
MSFSQGLAGIAGAQDAVAVLACVRYAVAVSWPQRAQQYT